MIPVNDIFSVGRRTILTNATGNAFYSGPCRVFAIISTGRNATNSTQHTVFDSLTTGSGSEFTVGHQAGRSSFADIGPGGIRFSTGISILIGDANGECIVIYLPEPK